MKTFVEKSSFPVALANRYSRETPGVTGEGRGPGV